MSIALFLLRTFVLVSSSVTLGKVVHCHKAAMIKSYFTPV